jgi:antitoxin HicB
MHRHFVYPSNVEPGEDGRFLVTFPDVPGAATDGATLEEALLEAADCLDEAVANLIALGREIPRPSRPKRGQHRIALPAQMAAKAALYLSIQKAAITNSELARRIGCDVREVRRLLDPRHPSKIGRVEEALAAVGQCLGVELRAIAR